MREGLVYLQRLAMLVDQLGLDTDITPTMALRYDAADGPSVRDRLGDLEPWARSTELDRSLGWVLDRAPEEVGVAVTCSSSATLGDPEEVAQTLSERHPLPMDHALSVRVLETPQGGVVVAKLNHLVLDAGDALGLFAQVCAVLGGTSVAPRVHRVDRDRTLAFYAEPSAADGVVSLLGDPPQPLRPGIPGRGKVETIDLRVGPDIGFSALLAAASVAMAPVVGEDQLWSYPCTPRTDRARCGYFSQVKQIKIRSAPSAAGPDVDAVRRGRADVEGLGRYSEGDAPAFARRLSRHRVPRLVLTSTSFYRVAHPTFDHVRTTSHRSLDDVRLLWDRTHDPEGALRLQYKTQFLDDREAHDVAHRLEALTA